MKSIKYQVLVQNSRRVLLPAIFLLLGCRAGSQEYNMKSSDKDMTLSPYFYIRSNDAGTDAMPLKSTSAKVNIAGVIADVTITQVYMNEGTNVLEAIYVFPASARAAVYAMKMRIGKREIVARVEEKNRAKQQYEEARQQGKTASLLEQQRPNVFQMSVANIVPGDVIEVELKYSELLVPENAVYEYVYPAVVGPRYSNQTKDQAPGDSWIENPYLHEGEAPNYKFNIAVNLNAGMPVNNIRSVSHEIETKFSGKAEAEIKLKDTGVFQGNRDFILQYRLAGNQVQAGTLLFQDKEENFFLTMIQPPSRVAPEQIPPREYIFIVDVSGSMHGFPLGISKKIMKELLSGLKPIDRFNVILFAGSSQVLFQASAGATTENIARATSMIDKQQGGGGTELLPILRKALAMSGTEDYSRTFVIITDGYVSVEKEAFDLISNNLGTANFFAFGTGSSVNRYLIEGIAHVGAGEPIIVTRPEEAEQMAKKFIKYVSSPILTGIKATFKDFDDYEILPNAIPDVFGERPVIITGKYRGKASGQLTVTGITGAGNYVQVINLDDDKGTQKNAALKYLWVREKIRLTDDYNKLSERKDLVDMITNLGLKYNLLTGYTSFIAIDSEVRADGKTSTTVRQPLPLPEGVSDYAVGGMAMKSKATNARYASYGQNSIQPELKELDSQEERVYSVVEKMPEYPGGMAEFKKYILKNIRLPEGYIRSGDSKSVNVRFTVGPDGSLRAVKLMGEKDPILEKELVRILMGCPKWQPGLQIGIPVKVRMTIPLTLVSSN